MGIRMKESFLEVKSVLTERGRLGRNERERGREREGRRDTETVREVERHRHNEREKERENEREVERNWRGMSHVKVVST